MKDSGGKEVKIYPVRCKHIYMKIEKPLVYIHATDKGLVLAARALCRLIGSSACIIVNLEQSL